LFSKVVVLTQLQIIIIIASAWYHAETKQTTG